jgi:hypothetical protein
MVEPNTTFLLCSDGITRHVSDPELQTLFTGGAEPRLICEQLKELCYSRGAEDNLTAVIVRTFAEGVEEIEDFDATVPVMEDETIATARSAYAAAADDSAGGEETVHDTISQIDLDEIVTGELRVAENIPDTAETPESEVMPNEEAAPAQEQEPQFVEPLAEPSTDEQFLLTESEEASYAVSPAETGSTSFVPQSQPKEQEFSMFGSSPHDSYEETGPSKRGFGRILVSLGLLILGGAMAVGASYYLGFTGPQQVVDAPQVETMKSQNIPLTSFEETRRTVDSDPAAYASRTSTPTDAADFYLLGRALMLTGKTVEAKRQFELARERLPQVDANERKTLANEIALALAVVDNPQALENFKNASNTAISSNSNTAINSPIR